LFYSANSVHLDLTTHLKTQQISTNFSLAWLLQTHHLESEMHQ